MSKKSAAPETANLNALVPKYPSYETLGQWVHTDWLHWHSAKNKMEQIRVVLWACRRHMDDGSSERTLVDLAMELCEIVSESAETAETEAGALAKVVLGAIPPREWRTSGIGDDKPEPAELEIEALFASTLTGFPNETERDIGIVLRCAIDEVR